jgi:hypothetical protein
MKKSILLLACLGLLLAGCQGYTTQALTPTLTPLVAVQTMVPVLPTNLPTQVEMAAVAPGCTVISPKPTPGPTQTSLFPPPAAGDWVTGPVSATVTLTEYSDFQ